MLLLLISFIAGVLTVLAPCILPLLPVIVGGSLAEGKVNVKKALTVVTALGLSVILFTLLLKVSTAFITIPEYTWKLISGGIVLFLGLVTVFPALWESQILAKISAKSNILLGKGDRKKSFWGDVIVGAALGPVFSTCSPTYFIVLATVLPVSPVLGMVYLLSYVIGLSLSLLLITFLGQKIMDKLGVASDPNSTFKRVLGIIFIIVGLAVITGFDKKIESSIIGAGFFDVTKVEQKLLEIQNKPELSMKDEDVVDATKQPVLSMTEKDKKFDYVPELSSIDGYINTDGKEITLASLKGKVVLLDIWTYSCINCQRTLPYLNDWYAKYHDQGLEIVGLHTPEFGFEKVQSNVEDAVKKFGIKYPVVLDNDYSTWRALGNQYWPRKYLVDIDGYIVYDHIGEGSYEETEKAIQKALQERANRMGTKVDIPTDTSKPKDVMDVDSGKVKSPETYFGFARNNLLANGKTGTTGEQILSVPLTISSNKLYLGGTWNMTAEYAENKSAGSIVFAYEAKNVYITAGSADGVEIEIYKDDVFVKKVTIKNETLYQLIGDIDYGKHTLRIVIPKVGLQAFTFTFG
jgi:cytochrome c biogenesis protein CcdA/thiol-disulfide isomerase/thioredoxin